HRHERRCHDEPERTTHHIDGTFDESNAPAHGSPYHARREPDMVASLMAPIRLTVPGTLRYRDVAVRIVAEAARLVSGSTQRDPFDTAVVSAFMEIFNNVAIHAYQRKGGGSIEIAITPTDRELVIEVKDHGHPFDIDNVAP